MSIENIYVCIVYSVSVLKKVLDNHKKICIPIIGAQAIKLPETNTYLKLENYHKQLRGPFVIYSDFEAIVEKVQGCQPSSNKLYTEAYQKHTDCGYGY